MKLPFLKNKEEEEQSEIDRIIQENIEKGKDGGEEPAEQPIAIDKDAILTKLTMDVDKLKAQIEAFSQMRQLSEQRFQRISEELGDLRRTSIDREKEINTLRVEATKACDMVGSVQPEKLMMNLEREKIKIEELVAMHESNKKIINYMADEIKKLRNDISAFRGAESLIKLNDDVRVELNSIKKVQLTVEKHADQVEDIFINMQKKFNDVLKLSDDFKALQSSFNGIMKDANKFKVEFNDLATKKDLAKLEELMTGKLSSVEDIKKDMIAKRDEITGLIDQANNSCTGVKALEDTLKSRIVEIDLDVSKFDKMERKGYITIEKFDEELDEFFKNIIEKLEDHKKEVEERISLRSAKNGV